VGDFKMSAPIETDLIAAQRFLNHESINEPILIYRFMIFEDIYRLDRVPTWREDRIIATHNRISARRVHKLTRVLLAAGWKPAIDAPSSDQSLSIL
jgi:hypothetical protein